MKTYISLLRGINVSGQKKIKMVDLKALYETMGFEDVKTYIQSGNVVFRYQDISLHTLEEMIKNKIKETYGYEVRNFVLTPEYFKQIVEHNPFLNADPDLDIKQLYVTFLSEVPDDELLKEIEPFKKNAEASILSGQIIYLRYPNGYGTTKLDNGVIERKLKLSATTRNWRTTKKLYDIASS